MKTVLVVKNDKHLGKLIYHALRGSCKVLQAENRLETRQTLDKSRVDLVLLDLHRYGASEPISFISHRVLPP